MKKIKCLFQYYCLLLLLLLLLLDKNISERGVGQTPHSRPLKSFHLLRTEFFSFFIVVWSRNEARFRERMRSEGFATVLLVFIVELLCLYTLFYSETNYPLVYFLFNFLDPFAFLVSTNILEVNLRDHDSLLM